MAPFFVILRALARSVWRDVRTLRSIGGNNFTMFVLLVMYQQPQSVYFFFLILGVLVLGPLAADPLRKIPPDRFELWPLSPGQRIALRLTAPLLTPLVWIALPLIFMAGIPIASTLIALALVIQLAAATWNHFAAGRPKGNAFRYVPRLPGRLGGLVRKNLRQMLSVLDPYVALVLSAGGLSYRLLASNPDPEASVILAVIVVVALSTSTQCLFGLDLPGGVVRYRLLPLPGWEILLAKDLAFLCILLLLVAPLAPLPGLAAGLVALAVGHHASVTRLLPQVRWRFTGGEVFPAGFLQLIPMTAIGVAVARASAFYLGLPIAAYLLSLWFYGRRWDSTI